MVPYRITICGLEELRLHSGAGVSHVLTILDPGWPDPREFENYGAHSRHVWRFHDTINARKDMTHPTAQTVTRILDFGRTLEAQPVSHLLVHCHMGISRSTAATAILLAQDSPGREDMAFARIREIRPKSWPNSRMIALADVLLGRGGRLFTAMQDHHRIVAHTFPDFATLLKDGERAHEVPEGI